MSSSPLPLRTVTELDHVRIHRLARQQPGAMASEMVELIDDADLVGSRDVPADVVTMHSQVRVARLSDGEQRLLTLCYPAETDPAKGLVSVFSPMGRSLLGLPVGATTRWTAPDGVVVTVQVLDILFQPEASGNYTL